MGSVKYNPLRNEFDEVLDKEEIILPQLVWHITDVCPLCCPYCFATKSQKETSKSQIDQYIKLFEILGIQKIDISGGEPLTYKRLPYVVEELKKLFINITITTSGTAKPIIRQWLLNSLKDFSRVIVSLDGSSQKIHDKLRGRDGTFNKLVELVFDMKEAKYPNVRINTVVTKHLLEEESCYRLTELINVLTPKEWCLIEPHPSNKKENFEEYAVTREQFSNICDAIQHISSKINLNSNIIKRTVDNYCRYWVLLPDGKVFQHSRDAIPTVVLDFEDNTITSIKKLISRNGVWLPNKEGGMIYAG